MKLDHDAEMEPMHGMYGTLDVELDVVRTIKRAELTASVSSKKVIGPTMVHVDNEGINDGSWRSESLRWPRSKVTSPSSASTSAAFHPEIAASTWSMTRQSPPQRILSFLNIHEQAAAGIR